MATKHHGVKDAVITCIDYRFRARSAAWIKRNLKDQADLIAVAGASKALLDKHSASYVLSLIKIAVDLHGIKRVHIVDHMDCGAYGGSKEHAGEVAEEIFDLFDRRKYSSAMVLTSNRDVEEWGEMFPDPVLANATIDRMFDRAEIVVFQGKSYRLRGRITLPSLYPDEIGKAAKLKRGNAGGHLQGARIL